MSAADTIALERLMPSRLGSVDPTVFPDEEFDLYSVPAFDLGEPEVLEGRRIGSVKQIVEPGDVLLSRIVPHIRRAWVVGRRRGRRIIASGEWIVFRGDSIEPTYLRHLLMSDPFHAELMRTVSGVGGSLLRARPAYVGKIRISVPPLGEQRRIAEILDKADAIRAKRRLAIAELDFLSQSIFFGMFGDPIACPRWPISRVADVLNSLEYGPRFYNEEYSADGIRIVRITDLSESGYLDFKSMPRLRVTAEEFEKHVLRPGDIIFARTGATVGKTAMIRYGDPPCIAGAYFIVLRFDERIEPLYARAVLSSRSVRALVEKRSRQAAQQNFSGPGIRELPIPLPPLPVQQEFARLARSIEKLREAQGRSTFALDSLFASLQASAFVGEM